MLYTLFANIACRPSRAIIMHHPLPSPHRKGVILGYFQIIHRLRPRHHLPARHHTHTAIRPQEVHAQLDLTNWQEAVFHGEEGVLLVSMDHLALLGGGVAPAFSRWCGYRHRLRAVVVVGLTR